jgi:hypothetical protein
MLVLLVLPVLVLVLHLLMLHCCPRRCMTRRVHRRRWWLPQPRMHVSAGALRGRWCLRVGSDVLLIGLNHTLSAQAENVHTYPSHAKAVLRVRRAVRGTRPSNQVLCGCSDHVTRAGQVNCVLDTAPGAQHVSQTTLLA